MEQELQQLRSHGMTDEQILNALSKDLATNPAWVSKYGAEKVSRCLYYVEFLYDSLQQGEAA